MPQSPIPNLQSPISNFRYELKLACPTAYLAQARMWLRTHPAGFRTTYPTRTVNNIYLDTPHLTSYNANLMGVGKREKLRLRWYGTTPAKLVLERKYKENLLGGKERVAVSARLDLEQAWSVILREVSGGVPAGWQHHLQTYTQPTLINRYQRDYLATPDNHIRATLDYDQHAYSQANTRHPNTHIPLPLEPLLVIEIKADHEHGDRLTDIMADFPIPRTRNSKYANGLILGN